MIQKNVKPILIVDDDSFQRSAIRIKLQMHGYEVNEARSGREAIEFLQHQDYALVLLDIVMPNFNGWEVLDKIRQLYDKDELPVIMMTASDNRYDSDAALERGATDYLTKPIDFVALDKKFAVYLGTGQPAAEPVHDTSDRNDEEDPESTDVAITSSGGLAESNRHDMEFSVLEGLTNNLPGVIFRAIADSDHSVQVTYQSDGLRNFLGSRWTNVADIVASSDRRSRQEINRQFREHGRQQKPIHIKFPCKTPEGQIGWVECRATPNRLPSGETVWDALLLDITASRELELELDHRRSLAGKFETGAFANLLQLYREHRAAVERGDMTDEVVRKIDATEKELEDAIDSMMATINEVQEAPLRIERASPRAERPASTEAEQDYRDSNGLVHLCSQCRKVHNFQSGAWEKVEAWQDRLPLNTSHTICPECETSPTMAPID